MKKLLLSVFLSAVGINSHAQLIINEFMQSNIDCIMDDLNQFPDSWVELYNNSSSAVSLSEYKIGLSDNPSEAYQLPQNTIAAKSYALIYCDKEGDAMHTDFRLDSGKGGAVYLFRNGTVCDKVENIKKQPAPNISFGRLTDASDTWGYQATPSPGAANTGKICSEILPEPVFSEEGRVFTSKQTISLSISIPEGCPEGTVIRLTYDGSEPTESSPVYPGTITISTTKIIRAKLFCDGYLSPRATTHSYIYFNRNLTLPVISIVTNKKYFEDSKIGIYVDGSYSSSKKNYEHNWRRPVNVEYFAGADQQGDINQLCETRVMGGASRSVQLKSLAVYAHKRFGKKRFKYEFFPDQRPGIDIYKSILLRNAGNDFDYLYMRDAIIQRTMAVNSDLDWQAWSPAIIYFNGTYKGILNIRERSNEDNIYSNYDGLEDIDMVENWDELKEGDLDNYNRFQEFYAGHGHTMAEYDKWMDCIEFINLMAMNLYYNNQDFPGNNFVMWRPRTDDGRWRFIAKDTDFGLGLYGSSYSYKSIEWLYNPDYDSNRAWANQYKHTRLFRRLMDDADFKREFIDRCAIYMGDFMNEKGTRAVWDPMYDKIKTEYPNHRKLINQWWPDYSSELSSARSWLKNRTASFYQQLADYYSLGSPTPLTVSVNNETADGGTPVSILFNGVKLTQNAFDGKFFANRDVTLQGEAGDADEVKGWRVVETSTSGNVTTAEIAGSQLSFTMPECKSLVVIALLQSRSGIDNVTVRDWTYRIDGDQLVVSRLGGNTRVALYDVQGMQLFSGVSSGGDMTIPLSSHRLYILKVGDESVKISY